MQEKQKNGERRALQLLPVTVGSSLALEKLRSMSATEYYADKSNTDFQERAATKITMSSVAVAVKSSKAEELLAESIRRDPGVVRGRLLKACLGNNVGKDILENCLDALIEDGRVRIESSGSAKNAPKHHYLTKEA